MPPSSSRTHFRQRPYRKRRPRAVGSDLKGCVLWLLSVHPSDLVHSSCEGASKTSRADCEKGEREEDPTILLLLGRDDLVLSACLNKSALPSDIDTPTWSNRASLRVRFTEGISSQSGRWMLSALVRVPSRRGLAASALSPLIEPRAGPDGPITTPYEAGDNQVN